MATRPRHHPWGPRPATVAGVLPDAAPLPRGYPTRHRCGKPDPSWEVRPVAAAAGTADCRHRVHRRGRPASSPRHRGRGSADPPLSPGSCPTRRRRRGECPIRHRRGKPDPSWEVRPVVAAAGTADCRHRVHRRGRPDSSPRHRGRGSTDPPLSPGSCPTRRRRRGVPDPPPSWETRPAAVAVGMLKPSPPYARLGPAWPPAWDVRPAALIRSRHRRGGRSAGVMGGLPVDGAGRHATECRGNPGMAHRRRSPPVRPKPTAGSRRRRISTPWLTSTTPRPPRCSRRRQRP
ncbi:hypothetical protein FB563_1329 [Streptomyces puniciscabiei]|uniref:Uncharacterized protein n=1 Tax=Streptomyces puniciscabiei TaxID=164348 RepID=A0A542UBC2_9ACTN|nr:hypothetical protein FB563_1329 [Streptomyces puniciscabiei]